MCGINGALRLTAGSPLIDRDEVLRTREYQTPRGPDGAGLWMAPDGRIALANNRLAILDLSAAAAMPMQTADGRYHITFNGEIYNFRELRDELIAEGTRFRTNGDTEVVLTLFARYGTAMLSRLRGMFALAIWDEQRKSLLLARDSHGIKPLYYSTGAGILRFASQVKGLLAGGALSRSVDLGAVGAFLLWGAIPEPCTLYESIRQLPAGHYMTVERDGAPSPEPFLPCMTGQAAATPLSAALEQSVTAHLVSDVPLAVFLSSGLDSAMLAALARRQRSILDTITIRFPGLHGTHEDEGALAGTVAVALGTRHHEVELSPADLRASWPAAVAAMDQPSIDGFNTFLISRAAHQAGFKVVLSGLGGDELFGSYPSFRDVPRLVRVARLARAIPGLWRLSGRAATIVGRPKVDGLLRYGDTLPGAYFLRRGLFLPDDLPGLLGAEAAAEAARRYEPIADAAAALAEQAPVNERDLARNPWLAVHQLESTRYLRRQLLRDADWASMAWSVELRVPLVDVLLREQAFRPENRRALLAGKAAIVRATTPELPASLFGRKKSGFYVPLAAALSDGDGDRTPASRGRGSRSLALRVLAEHGVELPFRYERGSPRTPSAYESAYEPATGDELLHGSSRSAV